MRTGEWCLFALSMMLPEGCDFIVDTLERNVANFFYSIYPWL